MTPEEEALQAIKADVSSLRSMVEAAAQNVASGAMLAEERTRHHLDNIESNVRTLEVKIKDQDKEIDLIKSSYVTLEKINPYLSAGRLIATLVVSSIVIAFLALVVKR